MRFPSAWVRAALDLWMHDFPISKSIFSTTSKSPDLLSSKFAENIGADDTVVYSGALRLTNNFLETYGLHIFLQHPFLYDPRSGNLLLDVRNYQTPPPLPPTPPGQAWLMAASATFGDSTSLAAANDVNSDTAVLNSGGLLTVFNVTVVPEPSPALIWGLASPLSSGGELCFVMRELGKRGTDELDRCAFVGSVSVRLLSRLSDGRREGDRIIYKRSLRLQHQLRGAHFRDKPCQHRPGSYRYRSPGPRNRY